MNKAIINFNPVSLVTVLMAMILFSTGSKASAVTLDSSGAWRCTCQAGSLTSHSFDKANSKAFFSFSGPCQEYEDSSFIGTRKYQINAVWDGKSKTAFEDVSYDTVTAHRDPTGKMITYHYAGSARYSCPDNPWLNSVNCTPTGQTGDISSLSFEGQKSSNPFDIKNVVDKMSLTAVVKNLFKDRNNPISSGFIPAGQRQSLAAEGTLPLPQGSPVILSPTPNSIFWVPARVEVKIQHNPAWGAICEFEKEESVRLGWIKPDPREAPVMKTSAGLTSGELHITQPSKWRIRVRSNYPGSSWGNWVEFKAETIKKEVPVPRDRLKEQGIIKK